MSEKSWFGAIEKVNINCNFCDVHYILFNYRFKQ